MQFRKIARITSAATVALLALGAVSPVVAHDGPPREDMPHWKSDHYSHHRSDIQSREAWLEDCRRRLDDARGRCEAYLDDYYAYYARYGSGHPGYGYHGQAYGAGCCQPMMMVPIYRIPKSEPECTETVEYEYVDVPVRAAPRPVPQKRVKIVPDKRIPVK